MNKRFTKLIAALALLVFMTPSLAGWGQTRTELTYDFSEIEGFSEWTNSYSEHVVAYEDATVTFASASRQTSTITDIPVTKGQPVSLVLNDVTNQITSATFVCRQWGTKAQTITLHYSTNGGQDYTSTGVTSSNFTISSNNLPEGTNAVKITFSSSSNQVGIVSATINIESSSSTAVATQVTIDATGITNTDVYTSNEAGSLSATVSANGETISGASVAWSSSNTDVATINENGEVTLVAAGTTTITAAYGGESGVYNPSSATYELAVTSSAPYVQPTTIEIIPNYTFWGEDAQFSGNTYNELEGSKDNVTLLWNRGNGSMYANTQAMRFYKDNILTFTAPEGYEIKSIVLTVSGTYSDLTFAPTGFDNETTTWTGSSETVTMSRPSNASSYATISKFTITIGLPSTDPSITANNISIEYDATEGEIAYTVENPVDGATVVATTTAEWLTIGTIGETVPFTCSVNEAATERTATVTLTYTYNRETVTKDVTITQAGNPNITMTIAEVRALGTGNVVTTGIVTSCVGTTGYIQDATAAICVYGSELTVGDEIKVSGTLTSYNGLLEIASPEVTVLSSGNTINPELMTIAQINASTNQGWYVRIEEATVTAVNDKNVTIEQDENNVVVRFASADDITFEVNDVVSLDGNIGAFNGVQIANPQNVEVQAAPVVPSINITDATIEVAAEGDEGILTVQYENITEIVAEVYFYDAEGATATYDWITAEIDADNNVEWLVEPNEGDARTAYFKVYALDDEANEVYSDLVTVNQAAYVAPVTGNNYELFSGNLVEGDYLIVYNGKAMNNIVEGDRLQYIEVTPNNDVIVTENAAVIWHIAPVGDYWTIYSANASAYAASTGAKNKAQMLDDGTDDKALWTVSGTETYEFVNKKNTANNVNANLRNNGTYGFACYAAGTGGALSLYKRNNNYTPALSITGYGEGAGNWYLVASPVSTTPEAAGMITDDLGAQATPETATYDLYNYDQNAEDGLEWRNYRTQVFNLEPGTGYLYANKNDVTLTFTGTAYEGDGSFNLVPGWNLVGNPFAAAAYIGRNFYMMNPAGSELIACTTSNDPIEAMHAVFVEGGDEDQVTFSTTAPDAKSPIVALNVTKNRGTAVDRAIVRFDEGQQLPKFQLNPNNTKLYIAQGNKDYAIVRSAAQGEMPVSFRAAENGTYTLSIETENVEMDYLHLIDNMTGMDVDLLQTPSYTFEAKTSDYASRFRLVFSANGIDEQNAETFAYFNGSEWQISNLGEATLQVVDVMGRVLSTETISGNAELSLNQPAGVYVFRLINGNDVKVQKVIVK